MCKLRSNDSTSPSFARVLADRANPPSEAIVVRELTEGKWIHDYPILVKQIKEWGLPIRTDMPEEVYA